MRYRNFFFCSGLVFVLAFLLIGTRKSDKELLVSEAFGFEIAYPQSWEVQSRVHPGGGNVLLSSPENSKLVFADMAHIRILVSERFGDSSLEDKADQDRIDAAFDKKGRKTFFVDGTVTENIDTKKVTREWNGETVEFKYLQFRSGQQDNLVETKIKWNISVRAHNHDFNYDVSISGGKAMYEQHLEDVFEIFDTFRLLD